jgi:hypothetical protein
MDSQVVMPISSQRIRIHGMKMMQQEEQGRQLQLGSSSKRKMRRALCCLLLVEVDSNSMPCCGDNGSLRYVCTWVCCTLNSQKPKSLFSSLFKVGRYVCGFVAHQFHQNPNSFFLLSITSNSPLNQSINLPVQFKLV